MTVMGEFKTVVEGSGTFQKILSSDFWFTIVGLIVCSSFFFFGSWIGFT